MTLRYKCNNCDNVIEVALEIHRNSAIRVCNECGSGTYKKQPVVCANTGPIENEFDLIECRGGRLLWRPK